MPIYKLKMKEIGKNIYIFDEIRKKYLLLTPEEWVRQNFIQYLNQEKKFPIGLIGVEKIVSYNFIKNRLDIIVYDHSGNPYLIVECKAPHVNINQETFYQIGKYNSQLKAKYLVVTNGNKHYCCEMNYHNNEINFLKEIPEY